MLSGARGFTEKLFFFPRYLTLPLMAHSRVSAFSTAPGLKRVGTHNGSFHCDEALGCFMIRLTDKFRDAQIVRTRDQKVLDGLDAVLDVGAFMIQVVIAMIITRKGLVRFLGTGSLPSSAVPALCTRWHFGMEIIAKELQLDQGHPDVLRLFLAVYKSFMEAVDAVDNGINQYDTDQPLRYVNNTHLSSRVGKLNLDWMDPDQSSEKENEAFERAMNLSGSALKSCMKTCVMNVRFHAKSWLPARSIVMECLAARMDIDPSGEIMVLNRFCPWKLHLFELEEEMKIDPPIKYVLYQLLPALSSQEGEDDRSKHWRVQAVAVAPDKFESRKPLPSQWRGLRDDELSREAGIPGCVFVHMSGFIGGNQNYEGALAMAKDALKL
ncbi:UPF0160 protein [Vitis vinifera]|uniref:UPF0160 protein n=1 Tax=Vitis vinifera TaxID=29760 RepID=A0A438BVB3_VITVI|nr:UPF0160 protein [Vitis vinifera]